MSNLPLRYPGAQPFETAQQHLFFGREKISKELYRLIKLERLVVLHSKSGMGKSSLLNASIIPKMLADNKYQPLRIRFNAWREGKENPLPQKITSEIIRGGVKSASTFLDKLILDEDTLWHDLKEFQIQNNNEKNLLLIFDQFEELFTYPKEAVEDFGKQLAEALSITLPQRYWTELENLDESELTDEELDLLQQPTRLKLVFAIRSDRMSLLDNLSEYLPTILKNCFQLNPLDIEQAKAAILLPAQATGAFASEPFDFETPALDNILDFLTQDKSEGIESTQLQLVCEAMEEKAMAFSLPKIRLEDTTNLGALIKKYYDEKIRLLKTTEQQNAARQLIEEQLIFESEERRISLYEGQILDAGVTSESLQILVDSHLLRAEPSPQGGFTYELSHDTLVAPVLEAKRKRMTRLEEEREREERLQKAEELKEARLKVAEEKKRAEEQSRLRTIAEKGELRARQRTRYANGATILALILAGMSFLFWKNANDANGKTIKALEEARAQKTQAIISDSLAQIAAANAIRQKEIAEEASLNLYKSDSISNKRALEAEWNLRMFNSSFADFLVSETERAMKDENYRLAYRLNEVALKKDRKNKKAKTFSKLLPFYRSNYSLEGQDYKLTKDSSFIAIKIRESEDDYILKVEDLNGEMGTRVFLSCQNYAYSNDDKFLTFWTKGEDEKYTTLNILELNNNAPPKVFKNCEADSDRYSKDSKYLTFWTKTKDKEGNHLNVYNFRKQSLIQTYEQCRRDSERFSFDSKFLTFLKGHSKNDLVTLCVVNMDQPENISTYENCDSRGYADLNVKSIGEESSDQPEFHTVMAGENLYRISRKYNISQKVLMERNNLTSVTIHPNQQLRISSRSFQNFGGGSNSESKFLSFTTINKEDNSSVLNVLNLENKLNNRTFDSSNNITARFSNDNKFLTFWTKDENGKLTNLHLLNLDGNNDPRVFENADSVNYRFTKDSKHLVFWKENEDAHQLQVIDLNGKSEPRVFENSYPLINRFSADSKYFIFWTKARNGTFTTLNVLDFDNLDEPLTVKNSFNFMIKFSPDDKHLSFWTKKRGEDMISLSVLNLEKKKVLQTFKNATKTNFRFSYDSKYLTLVTKENEGEHSMVKMLDLTKSTEAITVHNTDVEKIYYSRGSKYLVFWTKGDNDEFNTINVKGISNPNYSLSFENCKTHFFSPSDKYLVFTTKSQNNKYDTYSILELGKNIPLRTYPNSRKIFFSPDDKYLGFISDIGDEESTSFKVVDLESNKIIKEVYHQYPIEKISYLSEKKYMTTSTHPITKGRIYKIVDLGLGKDENKFYNKLFPKLTKNEKLRYGLTGKE